ncbi:MAG: response regulator [Phreatobacter sp.]|nr:response regulator [Phreatobacter sp.]
MRTETDRGAELFIVDDDAAVRDGLTVVFEQAGYRVAAFADASTLLNALQQRHPDAILLDVCLPGSGGVEVLRQISQRRFEGPVVMMSGRADIPMAVAVIQAGAADLVEKPLDGQRVVQQVGQALAGHARRAAERADPVSALGPGGASLLTPRERDVLQELVRGASNKEAGRSLGISPRTIEVHRARIMEKLGARNAADLVRVIYDERRHDAR